MTDYADLLLEISRAAGDLERLGDKAAVAVARGNFGDAVAFLAEMQQLEAVWFPNAAESPAVALAERLGLSAEVEALLSAPAPVHGSARLWDES